MTRLSGADTTDTLGIRDSDRVSISEGVSGKSVGGLRTKGYYKHSSPDKPLISVITVVYNGVGCLEGTIVSVLEQSYDHLEYIIVDGGSTDGTIGVLKKFEHAIDYWISEKDEGIYDAMNRGISLANGKGLVFLNAADRFVDDVLNGDTAIPCFLRVKYENRFKKTKNAKIRSYKTGLPNCHQGIVFENLGIEYKTRYRLAADYAFYLDHGYTYLPVAHTPGYVLYDNSGVSGINDKERDLEIAQIIKERFGPFFYLSFEVKSKIKHVIKRLALRS